MRSRSASLSRVGARRLDIDRGPRRVQAVGDAAGIADQRRGVARLADADQHAIPGVPRAGYRVRPHVRQQLIVDALRGPPQRQLAQRGQIARLEVMPDGALGLLRHIDLAFVQPLDQVVGRDIDDLDVVGLIEDAVGHGLAHADAGDPGDHVVEAVDVLDVQRREHIDAGGDQFLDIEVAFGMATAGRVAVGQFVDQHELRPALQDRVEIHLGEAVAFVFDLAPRNDLQAVQQGLGLAASVRLDDPDDHIDALAPLGLRRQQHLVGLADARRGAEKDLEPTAALLIGGVEQRLR